MVSVSRFAGLPHFGQGVFRKSARLFNGLPLPSGTQSSGSTTGSWSSGTGTSPHAAQCTIGIGQPQYRWRETPQSRNRQVTCLSPRPFPLRSAAIASTDRAKSSPSYLPEYTQTPWSVYHDCQASSEYCFPSTSMTCTIGSPYFLANAK